MPIPRALPIALATLGGIAVGWVIKPTAAPADTAKETAEPVLKRETRRAPNEDSRIAARWIDRMATDDWEKVGSVAKEVPTAEIKTVMDGMMAGVWGSLSNEDLTRMQLLIAEWVERDPEGALEWARNLRHPQQREIGLSCIAATIGKKDPEAGFAIYTELDKVTMKGNPGLLFDLVGTTYNNAAKLGPAALLDAMKRLPASAEGWGMGFMINYPENFDFNAMVDGMTKAGYFNLTDRPSKPYSLEGAMGAWAKKDRDAAFDYVVDHAKEGTHYKLYELTFEITSTHGKAQTQAWLGEKLSALDSAQRQQLVKGSLLRYGETILNSFVEAMPTEEAAMEFRYDILQATGESGNGRSYGILNELPEMEDRLAMIGRLQNIRDTEPLVEQLREWQVPQERINGIVEKVKRKESRE